MVYDTVSWLPGHPSFALPGAVAPVVSRSPSPVTVAGAAPVFHRLPAFVFTGLAVTIWNVQWLAGLRPRLWALRHKKAEAVVAPAFSTRHMLWASAIVIIVHAVHGVWTMVHNVHTAHAIVHTAHAIVHTAHAIGAIVHFHAMGVIHAVVS